MKKKKANLPMMPVVFLKYFLAFEKNYECEYEDETIADALAYLIKSNDGDHYYLTDLLVEDKVLTRELGNEIYQLVDNVSTQEIFEWYQVLKTRGGESNE